jgi:hypothetical protein
VIKLLVEQRKLKALVKQITSSKARQRDLLPGLARDLARGMAAIVRRRIKVTKTAPDGVPWRAWATGYARTRKAHHSLLVDTRKLLGNIVPYSAPSGKLATISAKVPYAGYVQAKRPFLGVGDLEQTLVDTLAARYVRRMLG